MLDKSMYIYDSNSNIDNTDDKENKDNIDSNYNYNYSNSYSNSYNNSYNNHYSICIVAILIYLIFIDISIASFTPPARYEHSSILINSKLYILGGRNSSIENNDSIFNDIFYLDLSSSFDTNNPPWKSISSSPDQSNQTSLKSFWGTGFLGRNDKSSIFITSGITGINHNNSHNNNSNSDDNSKLISEFNIDNQIWSFPSITGTPPERRKRFQFIDDGNGKLYIFGGFEEIISNNNNGSSSDRKSKGFNDIFIFDSITLNWSHGSNINAPNARYGAATVLMNDGKILFIGGKVLENNVNNTWIDADMKEVII